jgi:hypothetical protein
MSFKPFDIIAQKLNKVFWVLILILYWSESLIISSWTLVSIVLLIEVGSLIIIITSEKLIFGWNPLVALWLSLIIGRIIQNDGL